MKLLRISIAVLVVFMAGEALAQNSMPRLPSFGGGPQPGDRGPVRAVPIEKLSENGLLAIAASQPIARHPGYPTVMGQPNRGEFRIIFRVNAEEAAVPFVTIGYGGFRADYILDWTAVSSTGAQCSLTRDKIRGVDVFSGSTIGVGDAMRSLSRQRGAGSIALPNSSILVLADFYCDGVIMPGDQVSIQTKFFTLAQSGWRPLVKSYDNLQVVGGR